MINSEGCARLIPAAIELGNGFSDRFGHLKGTFVDKIRKVFNFQHAGVAELVDARDLKSLFPSGK